MNLLAKDTAMTNFERAKKLINDARTYKEEAEQAFESKEWNRTIRRAQESVELYLKGIMKMMNIEVPKIHDVSKIFVIEIEKKGKKLRRETAEKIIRTSSALSEKRAPAFYREEEYTEDDAKESIEAMRFIAEFIEKLLKEFPNERAE